jgi:tripartite-type tricarboxylate transporter receptor subunit TctC
VNLPRRQFLHLAAGAVALPAVSHVARAQAYPSRPITLIVPFPAGGGADVIARIMAEQMRIPLGQPIIIENIGGATEASAQVAPLVRGRMVTQFVSASTAHMF